MPPESAAGTEKGSSLFPIEWLLGLPEGSGAKRSPGSGPLSGSRVSATHPNPAWHPKQSSLWHPGSSNPAPDRPGAPPPPPPPQPLTPRSGSKRRGPGGGGGAGGGGGGALL